MVDLKDLQPGMRVKIVDLEERRRQKGWASSGDMDKYCGTIQTVAFIRETWCSLKGLPWLWLPEMLEYIVHEDEEDEQEYELPDLSVLM